MALVGEGLCFIVSSMGVKIGSDFTDGFGSGFG